MSGFDYAAWPRREQYEFFSRISQPFYGVSFELDVTELRQWARARGVSFYYALTYLVTRAVNRTEAFLIGIRDGQVVRYDRRAPSFTDLHPGSESFHIVTMEAEGTMEQFCRAAREKSMAQECFISAQDEKDSLIFISCLPWLPMTAMSNERDFDRDDSVPRVNWGKYTERDGRLTLNMSVECNHRFIDGVHIGRFYETLRASIAELR